MRTKALFTIFFSIVFAVLVQGCIEDGIDTSPSSQPEFSTEMVEMGTVFTGERTPTLRLMVYNRHDKVMNISNISLRESEADFRINVDGMAGKEFSNVEIRPKDSMYVFIDALIPEIGSPNPAERTGHIDFVTNGVTTSVKLRAVGQDALTLRGDIVTADMRLDSSYPYRVFDSLVVARGATLIIPKGAKLHFHDSSYMRVYGSLLAEGTPDAPIDFAGDRMGNVVSDIPFDLMASQWNGLEFAADSRGNKLSHTSIRNTTAGVIAGENSEVQFLNCRLRNSAGYAVATRHADLTMAGCEIAEAGKSVLSLVGGTAEINHCTFANYYLFSPICGALVEPGHYNSASNDGSGRPFLRADFSNCILYGSVAELSVKDLTGSDVHFRRCLFGSNGSDDDNFTDCLWGADPLYGTVRDEYLFDYRLRTGSPAIGSADPALVNPAISADFYGIPRLPAPNLGAYQSVIQ